MTDAVSQDMPPTGLSPPSANSTATPFSPEEIDKQVEQRYLKLNPSAKGWQLTLNNPDKHGYTAELLIALVKSLPLVCMCLVLEIGDNGTPHYHIYLLVRSRIRFSTLHNLIPEAHIERAAGNAQQNRDYLLKRNTLRNKEKAHTQVPGTYYEWGEFPTPSEENNPSAAALLEALRKGQTTSDILDANAGLLLNVRQMDTARTALQADYAQQQLRQVKVSYVFGAVDADLTAAVYARHKSRDICRIVRYDGVHTRFDHYAGQDVLLLDNFNGDIPLRDLLQMMGKYPYFLPARFTDKPACYHYLYIVSPLPPNALYPEESNDQPLLFDSYLQRIDEILGVSADGTQAVYTNKPILTATAVELPAADEQIKGERNVEE